MSKNIAYETKELWNGLHGTSRPHFSIKVTLAVTCIKAHFFDKSYPVSSGKKASGSDWFLESN